MPGVIVCMLMPISCRRSWPYCFSCRNTVRTVALGIAKPSPSLPPDCDTMNVLTPTTSPRMLTSGPPELPGIDRRVGLHVDQRRVGIDLPRHRRHQPVRQGVAQADRAAERKHRLALPHLRVGGQRQRRQLQAVDLQQRQIQFGGDADDARGDERASCPTAPSPASRPRCRPAARPGRAARRSRRARWS